MGIESEHSKERSRDAGHAPIPCRQEADTTVPCGSACVYEEVLQMLSFVL